MAKKEEGFLIPFVVLFIVLLVLGVASFLIYKYSEKSNNQNQPTACSQEAKICPDGSSVARTGANCEFAECPSQNNTSQIYKNDKYGFEMTLPATWSGYSVSETSWNGNSVTGDNKKYQGVMLVFRNSKWTEKAKWQDIPIMIFNQDIWKLVQEEKISLGAAPIGPSKVGENQKYIFATPARWYGFTDAQGQDEAVEIVKTFKAF